MKFLVLICLACIFWFGTTNAQEEDLRLVYSGINVEDIFWSSDSQFLTFLPLIDAIYRPFDATWEVHNVVEESDFQITGLPFQTLLSRQTTETITAFSSAPMRLISPNGAYIITASEQTEFNENLNASQRQALRWETVILDTQSSRISDLGILALGIDRGPEYFSVLWSSDAETFVLSTSALFVSEPSFFHWVTGYSDVKQDLEMIEITSFDYENEQYSMQTALDLSLDGSNVLAITVSPTGVQGGRPLMIWNKDGNHINLQHVFDDRISSVSAAGFAPDKENEILVVNQRGLVLYSLDTGETSILRTDITSDRFRTAKFSPHGEQLALVDNTPGRLAAVYILDVAALLRSPAAP